MQKIIPSFFLLLLTPTLLVNVFASVQNEPTLQPGAPRLVYKEGDVSALMRGTAQAVALEQKGMILKEGLTITTGDESYCDIAFDEGLKNFVSIGPNSELEIGKDFKELKISNGRIFSQLKNLPSDLQFEIVTPQAIAKVHGAIWESNAGTVVSFNVQNGIVDVRGIGKDGKVTGQSNVLAGHSIAVDQNGRLGRPSKVIIEDEERMKNWSDRMEWILSVVSDI